MDKAAAARRPVCVGAFGWGVLPIEGTTADGKRIYGFTEEQLASPDRAYIMVPTLGSTLDLSRLRQDLQREQERSSPASPTRSSPDIRDRQSTGEPMNKVRKAVRSDQPPRATEPSPSPESNYESDTKSPDSARRLATVEAPEERLDSSSSSSSMPAAEKAGQRPDRSVTWEAAFAPAIRNLLDQRTAVKDLARELRRLFRSIHPDHQWEYKSLVYTEEFLVQVFSLLPSLKDEPAKRDLLGKALGYLGHMNRGHLNPASQAELGKALNSSHLLTSVPVDQICQFLASADSAGRWDTKAGQADKPAQEKLCFARYEHTAHGSKHLITQGVIGMFKAQVRANNPSPIVVRQWLRAILETFDTDAKALRLVVQALGELPFDAETRANVEQALYEPIQRRPRELTRAAVYALRDRQATAAQQHSGLAGSPGSLGSPVTGLPPTPPSPATSPENSTPSLLSSSSSSVANPTVDPWPPANLSSRSSVGSSNSLGSRNPLLLEASPGTLDSSAPHVSLSSSSSLGSMSSLGSPVSLVPTSANSSTSPLGSLGSPASPGSSSLAGPASLPRALGSPASVVSPGATSSAGSTMGGSPGAFGSLGSPDSPGVSPGSPKLSSSSGAASSSSSSSSSSKTSDLAPPVPQMAEDEMLAASFLADLRGHARPSRLATLRPRAGGRSAR